MNVQSHTKCNMAAKCFLSNEANKQVFIYLLASSLQQHNIKVLHAEDDADLLIARTAIEIAEYEDSFSW